MNTVRLAVRDDATRFRPGDEVVAAAYWKLERPPKAVQVRLFWFTRGKGTQDVTVVETVAFDRPLMEEARPARFQLPEAPFSFSGKLISLTWALELVVDPSGESARVELIVSPTGEEILLQPSPVPPSARPATGGAPS